MSCTTLVRASDDSVSGEVVPLAKHEQMLGMYFNVTFAILYPGAKKPTHAALATALAKALVPFKALAGRFVLSKEGLAIDCNNAGVPLTHDVGTGAAPSVEVPIAADLFDMVVDSVPASEGSASDAPMRVKVTDFDDAQLIAVSANHGLCDAGGLGAFMAAWASAYAGGTGEGGSAPSPVVSNDRVGAVPTTSEPGSVPPETIPPEHPWRMLRPLPEQCPALERVPLASPVIFSNTKSAADCKALKAACLTAAAAPTGAFVSTNDALCAELCVALGLEGVERVPFGLIMDYRAHVGVDGAASPYLFGNLWCTLELLVRNSLAGAVDIREALRHAQGAEFIKWFMGQGANRQFGARLMMNTWVKAFRLAELAFEVPAADMMVGAPFLEQRLAMMAPAGVNYVIALPQADGGIKAVGVLGRSATERLTGKMHTVA